MDELSFTEAMARLKELAPRREATPQGKKMCEWCQSKPARLAKEGAKVCGACYFKDELDKGIGQIK